MVYDKETVDSCLSLMNSSPLTNNNSFMLYKLFNDNHSLDMRLDIESILIKLNNLNHVELLPKDKLKILSDHKEDLLSKRQKIKSKMDLNKEILEMELQLNDNTALQDRSFKIQQTLTAELAELDNELFKVTESLNNQYLKMLSAGYISNITHNKKPANHYTNNNDENNINTLLDDLFSHIASVAVKQNVVLPAPSALSNNQLVNKIHWSKDCINTVLANHSSKSLEAKSESEKPTDSREIINLKTALTDLQFSHKFIRKQYEDEKAQHNYLINNLNFKVKHSQDLLIETNKELAKQTSHIIDLEKKLSEAEIIINNQNKEINELYKKNNLLKIDHLGEQPLSSSRRYSRGEILTPLSTSNGDEMEDDKENNRSSLSPITNLTNNSSIPTTPMLNFKQESLLGSPNHANGISNSGANNNNNGNISTSILRLEFKKLINEINQKHYLELQHEKNENKKLENLIKLMNEKNDNNTNDTNAFLGVGNGRTKIEGHSLVDDLR
ncbi:hypothetical protein PACTADRAFT_47418 [Pachysolen tannophilus NRRL Y-2460]|uniref:Uncharacterized protein n=1 Tax=Pachysolen tannophilus NRRL Y-2460 TaxID=669874 RepID=A0A1E4U0J5_PACTA|nr:hypothetical protein PACTADRAFT_47418 [Pachysolen tannophilus NRRL Y-2460]